MSVGHAADAVRLRSVQAVEVDLGGDVAKERQLTGSSWEHVRQGDPAVEPFVDGSDTTGADDPDQAGVDEHVDVVGDRATRSIDPLGDLGDRHRPFEHEVDDRAPQRVAERLQPLRRADVEFVVQFVVRAASADRPTFLER